MRISDQVRRLGETLMVLCVVVLLVNHFLTNTDKSARSATEANKKSQVATIAGALRMYYLDNGAYPDIANRQSFCRPFDVNSDKQGRCLGELIGPYLNPNSVDLGYKEYVYVNARRNTFIATDLEVTTEDSLSNTCKVGASYFWCIKLPR